MTAFVKKLNHALLFLLFAVVMLCPLRAAAVDPDSYEVDASIPVSVEINENRKVPFTLELQAVDGAPLPKVTTMTFTGGGSGDFGPITYTAPGDYRYTISQKAGDAENVTYDTSVYTVSVFVTNLGEDKLQKEIKMWRGDGTDGKSSVAAFQNTYTAPQQGGGQATATPVPTASPAPTSTPAVSLMGGLLPQTGDEFPMTAVIVICVIAALCFIYVLYRKSRNNKK